MDFAKRQLEKYGWNEGKGLGRNEDGISQALKPKLKFDNTGFGHQVGEQFTNNWWERIFNSATENIDIETNGSDVKMKLKQDDAVEISTHSYSVKNLKKNTALEYGTFIKTEKITAEGTQSYGVVQPEPLKAFHGLTDDELFAVCDGRTVHKGARHGLKLSGKLSRLEKQEKLLLKKMKKFSLTDDPCSKAEKKLKKLKKHKENCKKYTPLDDPDNLPSTSAASTLKKKHKKRKTVSFNETITRIYTADMDRSFDSESGLLRDENSNENNNSGSDEGIEQDLENNNNDLDVDNHRAFEEARFNFSDLSKAERKKLKKKRKLDMKANTATNLFLGNIQPQSNANQIIVEEKEFSTKKRKHFEVNDDLACKKCLSESPDRLKRKRSKKKKKNKQKKEAKIITSIAKSLEGVCRISESE
ncbi:hypothetical protein ABEB36_009715 [Hypothenemus hampei]|uniref:G patch domain-containing protein 4 n=1 Tax=Hypothenemus hampei TaxID=57062 RepID=A0ABD1ELB1_HYPHA